MSMDHTPADPGRRRVPLALKLAYGGFVCAMVPAYWRAYGPGNFLWLSDVALFATTAAVIAEKPLPASMMAAGVLPFELVWCADVLTGGRHLGYASYMFDRREPRFLRALSLFHFALPPTWLWMLRRFGHDRRALRRQAALTMVLLPLTYAATPPSRNVNWVHGWGARAWRPVPPAAWLALEAAALTFLVLRPTDAVLRRLFPPPHASRGPQGGRA